MKRLLSGAGEFQGILERKEAELVRVLRTRNGIAIEKSADQTEEIQYASERGLAISTVDRKSTLLRQMKTTWIPWAPRCIQCQETADRMGRRARKVDRRSTVLHECCVVQRRRQRTRYPIALELRWSLTTKKIIVDRGAGWTVDLSSMGLRFQTDRELPAGGSLELSINWPAMLGDVTPLQLVIAGRIVRSTYIDTAVQLVRYEFRTRTLQMSGEQHGGKQDVFVLRS